jgi:hypothetical protein
MLSIELPISAPRAPFAHQRGLVMPDSEAVVSEKPLASINPETERK